MTVGNDVWVSMSEMQGNIYDKLNEEFNNGQRRFINALELPEKMRNVQVGLTPRERIWHKNKASLYHYYLPDGGGSLLQPGHPKPRIPLLIVYALINKPYVLDLRPNSSFIDYMLQRGFEVYLLDWGTPSDEDGRMRLDDYVLDYIPRAVRKMRQHCGVRDFTLLGYCMGGTLSLLYTAAHKDDQPENLILLATPVDFGQPNTFSLWLKEQYFNVDAMVSTLGIIPGEMVDFGSKMLKPFQNYVQSYLDLHGKLWDDNFVESWVAMNKWVNDGIPMSGETFRQWVNDFYRHNKLLKGEMELGSRQLNLKNITCNLLSVIADRDHIVPPEMTRPLMDAISSKDKYQHSIPAGHVGMVAGRGAVKQLWPMIGDWMEKRSQ